MGRPYKDLTGKQIGYWTVLRKVDSRVVYGNKQPVWLCRCICGIEKELPSVSLRSGRSRSCGCLVSELKRENLTGQRFGRLIVISFSHSKHGAHWNCRCDCGNETIVSAVNLKKTNGTRSCGCLARELRGIRTTKDETGNRYGRLVVVEKSHSQGGEWYWICQCDCGDETVVRGSHLRDDSTRSCGCLAAEEAKRRETTHGLTYTKMYKNLQNRKRKHRMSELDNDWTAEMEHFLRTLFGQCVLCGITEREHLELYGTSLHVDHVYPLSKGNGLKPGNSTILCAQCNKEKHATNPEDLPEPIYNRLIESAELFQLLWEGS